MMVHLSRQARRHLQRAVGDAEATIQSDARFFERFPARRHRVRLADRAEVEQFGIIAGQTYLKPGPDQRVFALICQIAPGIRLKSLMTGPTSEAGEEVPEHLAAALWAELLRRNPQLAKQQAQLDAAARRPGGPLHNGGAE